MDIIAVILLILRIFRFILLVKVILSWVLPPFHSVRRTLDDWFEPLLEPIRRVIPSTGGMDLSPLALFFLIYIIEIFLVPLSR